MSLEKTTEAAKGRWREILLKFGLDEKFLKDEHGPCPLCGGTDRYRWDNRDGSGGFYCSQCGAGTGMRLLMETKGWDFGKAAKEVDLILGTVHADAVKAERTEADKVKSFERVLMTSVPVTPSNASGLYLEHRCGDMAELLHQLREVTILRRNYLREQGKDPGKDPTVLQDLRHHQGANYQRGSKDVFPALLATVRYPNDIIATVHRTYLTPDGQKANLDPVRKVMGGRPLEGAAVRLGPIQERLGIAEGIETAICAGKLFGMPVWSALSANGILSWIPPEGVRSVVIFGDNDLNYVGQAAAYERARQLRVKGYDVEVQIPEVPGDWNDIWGQRAPLHGAA